MAAGAGPTRGGKTLESVWDYPLPPEVEASPAHAQVVLNGFVIADSSATLRVVQTGLAPAYYFPPEDVRSAYLRPNGVHTHCSYRGRASYFDVVVGDREVKSGAWTYRDPNPGFEQLADRIAYYPGRMDVCLLDGQPVRAEAEDVTGGWISANILGLSRGYPRVWDRSEDT
ncbi:MAG TPA: DUF427 domain-containing protein [Coriobacteriia bacterium]|jgi:uncharacterized protein (DUF427 family)